MDRAPHQIMNPRGCASAKRVTQPAKGSHGNNRFVPDALPRGERLINPSGYFRGGPKQPFVAKTTVDFAFSKRNQSCSNLKSQQVRKNPLRDGPAGEARVPVPTLGMGGIMEATA